MKIIVARRFDVPNIMFKVESGDIQVTYASNVDNRATLVKQYLEFNAIPHELQNNRHQLLSTDKILYSTQPSNEQMCTCIICRESKLLSLKRSVVQLIPI